jgi:tetratricopeptide (TPR) repeat protein
LTGTHLLPPRPVRALRRNRQVPPGLARIIARCLQPDARRRYPSAGELAADLRRQLTHHPLHGVSNGGPLERWRRWRRQKPHFLALFGLVLAVALACGGLLWFALSQWQERLDVARHDLDEGQRLLREHQHEEAYRVCAHGLGRLQGLPGQGNLRERLTCEGRRAERGRAADRLHALVDQMRFHWGTERTPRDQMARFAVEAQRVWEERTLLTDRSSAPLDPTLEERIQGDLLDLALLWTEIRLKQAPDPREERQAARLILEEANALCGPNPVLTRASQDLERTEAGDVPSLSRTAWEYCALGRSLMGHGHLDEALPAFRAALNQQPGDFWSHFYRGVCCYRLARFDEALEAFAICVALSPTSAECFHNRALAHAALAHRQQALQDYDRALALNPTQGDSALNRGLLHYQLGHHAQARADLEHALRCGAEPVSTHFTLALVRSAEGDRTAALRHLDEVLRYQPGHESARQLAATLRSDSGRTRDR